MSGMQNQMFSSKSLTSSPILSLIGVVAITGFTSIAARAIDLPKFKDFTPTYAVTDLGILPGYQRAVSTDLNNHGDATGIAVGPSDRGVLFQRGKVVDVAPGATVVAPGAEASYASALNARGEVTGYFYDGHKWKGFLFDHGNFKDFEVPNAQNTYSDSLNDVGQAAGGYTDANSNDHIFVRQPNGSFRDLGAFGIDPSALAINNQGRVLIDASDEVRDHAYLSRPGSAALEEVPSLIPNGSVSPGDMNQWGMVVGSATVNASTGDEHAYVYFEGEIKDLGVLPGGDLTSGDGINNLGQTVGGAVQLPKPILDANGKIVGFTPEIAHGWVSIAGKLRDLNELLNTASQGWVISEARKINDRGQVLADANFQGGDVHAVLLTPNAILPPFLAAFP